MATITAVTTKNEFKEFIDFPYDLYKGDPNFTPELFIAQRDLLKETHPFYRHSKLTCFIAKDGSKVVGRIAAIKNGNHIEFTGRNEGFFGFFDVINDYSVAKQLLDTAKEWIKKENLIAMLGPANPSTNETCGVLVKGFEVPSPVMLTYNKQYYPEFLEKYGLVKKMDLYAYTMLGKEVPTRISEASGALEDRLKKRGIVVRKLEMKNFKEEAKKVMEVYNKAWDKNWGFVPMTDDEFRYMAKDLKMILDPDLAFVAEHNGTPIGFSLSLPDINFILRKIPRGRLLPTGIFKLLFLKSKIKNIRIITLGIVEEYRRHGIEAIFYARTLENGLKKGYETADASWILENNLQMNRGLESLGAHIYKTFRIYEMPLNGK
jgi:GNAT superfamily N-acetyltransferase